MKMLDSDHCVAILRGQINLRNLVSASETLATTSISVGELSYGAHKSADPTKNLARLDVLLSALTLLPFDEGAARQFGRIKSQLERAGLRLSDLDLQIASIALHHQLPLVTHNRRHFERVPNLTIEDWLT
jgi:tRNA(fMet)-specific endonuclease VapC